MFFVVFLLIVHAFKCTSAYHFLSSILFCLWLCDLCVCMCGGMCVCAGAWIKSSWGHVQRQGNQLSLTYIAPQLGYWVAAMSPLQTGRRRKNNLIFMFCILYCLHCKVMKRDVCFPSDPVVAKDISTYHTVFLLAILGGMALILLCLLCLLLYYCRFVRQPEYLSS